MRQREKKKTLKISQKESAPIAEEKKESSWWKKWPVFLSVGFLLLILGLVAIFSYLSFSPLPGRTNILLLGMTGNGQAGSDLTDTMIFVSVENQTGEVFLLSLPRDIWIKALRTKLNSTYHYGGLDLAKKTVAEILGQPVDHAVLIDAHLFVEMIDFLGDLEIDVQASFDDYRYPIPGKENDDCGGDPEYQCRYEHLHFEAGRQQMDGETALKYVRSRYAEGEEGTDLARNERQQRAVLAVRDKLLSPQFLLAPGKPVQLFKLVLNKIESDFPQDKYFDFLKTAIRFRPEKLKTSILNDDLLINPPNSQFLYDGQWVLVPKAGGWSQIQGYVKELIAD